MVSSRKEVGAQRTYLFCEEESVSGGVRVRGIGSDGGEGSERIASSAGSASGDEEASGHHDDQEIYCEVSWSWRGTSNLERAP